MAVDKRVSYINQDGYKNYIKNSDSITVPKKFQSRKNAKKTRLAYITDAEAKQLKKQNKGTPHKGPKGIPSYDDYDASAGRYGRATSGQQMSAMETGGGQTEQNRVDARALGYTPQEVADIRGGAQQAAAMGQRGRGMGNFFSGLGRGIGNLATMFNPWTAAAGIMGNPRTAMFMNLMGRGKNRLQNLRRSDGQLRDQDYWSDENRYRRQMEAFRERYGKSNVQGAIDKDLINDPEQLYLQNPSKDYLSSIDLSKYDNAPPFMHDLEAKAPGKKLDIRDIDFGTDKFDVKKPRTIEQDQDLATATFAKGTTWDEFMQDKSRNAMVRPGDKNWKDVYYRWLDINKMGEI